VVVTSCVVAGSKNGAGLELVDWLLVALPSLPEGADLW